MLLRKKSACEVWRREIRPSSRVSFHISVNELAETLLHVEIALEVKLSFFLLLFFGAG